MKKTALILFVIILIVVSCVVCFSFLSGSDFSLPRSKDRDILTAINHLSETWQDFFTAYNRTGYLEIKNTRKITIKHSNTTSYFRDIDYIIEFLIYTNYLGTAPYYSYPRIYDTVVIYSNGSMEVVENNPIFAYTSSTFSTDYSDFIYSIVDCGSLYNAVLISPDE